MEAAGLSLEKGERVLSPAGVPSYSGVEKEGSEVSLFDPAEMGFERINSGV